MVVKSIADTRPPSPIRQEPHRRIQLRVSPFGIGQGERHLDVRHDAPPFQALTVHAGVGALLRDGS
jgi:hypothetical protein